GRSCPSGAAPPSATPTPPHEWGGAAPAAQPLRRLRRHLPMNGEELPLRRCPSGAAPPSATPTPPHEWGGACSYETAWGVASQRSRTAATTCSFTGLEM